MLGAQCFLPGIENGAKFQLGLCRFPFSIERFCQIVAVFQSRRVLGSQRFFCQLEGRVRFGFCFRVFSLRLEDFSEICPVSNG